MPNSTPRGGNSTRRSSKHPGVSLIDRPTGWVARWRDPATGRNLSQSFRALSITTRDGRSNWAAEKAVEIAQARIDIKNGVYHQKQQAKAEAEAAAEEAIRGAVGTPIDAAVQNYLDSIDNRTSRKARVSCMNHFKQWLAANEVAGTAQLSTELLRAYVRNLKREARGEDDDDKGNGRAVTTTNTWIAYIRRFVEQLANTEINKQRLDRNTREMRNTFSKFSLGDRENVIMQPTQAQAMLTAVHAYDCAPSWQKARKTDYGPFILAMLLGGFRPGELRSLTWGQVYFEEGYVKLLAYGKQRTKTKRLRKVTFIEAPMMERLLRAMKDASSKSNANDLVFPKKEGWQDAKTNRLSRDFKLDPGFQLKHCRATADTVLLYAPGIDATTAQIERRHGHRREVIRDHYEGELRVDPRATSIEAALGIEEIGDSIIARVRKTAMGEVAA